MMPGPLARGAMAEGEVPFAFFPESVVNQSAEI